MSNKLIRIILIIALTATVFVVRLFFSSINSLSYKIFNAEARGYYLHKMLGIVPKSYQDRYIENTLETFGDKELLNLVDQKGATHSNFILLRNKKSDVKFLKGYPFKLVGVSNKSIENSGWEKHVSLLIDLEVFNDYIQCRNLSSREDTIDKYCYFLSNPTDNSSYKILRDSISLGSLISEKPLLNRDFIRGSGYTLIEAQNIDFDQVSETLIYCWIYNKGVVKFKFTFNADNTLKSVDSEIIGLLGNEAPAI